MWAIILITVYCALIAAVSFLGGLLPTWIRLTHTQLQVLMSFVGGLILGVSLLHMLPHAMASHADLDILMAALLAGVLVMFFLMRMFHIHVHEPVSPALIGHKGESGAHDSSSDVHADHEHHEEEKHVHDHDDHTHAHHHHHHAAHGKGSASWIGLTIGFALHTLLDGVALAASIKLAAEGHSHFELLGLGIFLAIFLHKPLDAMSIAWTAQANHWSQRWVNLANIGFSLMCPLGALAFFFGLDVFGDNATGWVAVSLAFSAGVFLCISLSDILPEVSFHSHDRATLSVALVLGVVLAWSISFLEPDHVHSRPAQLNHQDSQTETK